MKTRYQYESVLLEIESKGLAAGLSAGTLTNPCVDAENVWPLREGDENFYAAMIRAAYIQAGIMAEEAGKDINEILGRIVY